MTLPNFILAGAYPAGSGQLYAFLDQHPDIYLPKPMQPECNFFFKTTSYEKGIDYYEKTWFSNVDGQKAAGERSSLLLCGAWVPERVAKHLPKVRLIFMLRNPVDRAYAHYRFTALAGFEEYSFEEALEIEEVRSRSMPPPFWLEIQPFSYFERGLYADQLTRWAKFFPAEQILLSRSDQLVKDRDKSLGRIFRFLGVDNLSIQVRDASDFTSTSVVDPKLQRSLRLKHPRELDAAIQKLRDGEPATTDVDRRFRANLLKSKKPLSDDLRRKLTRRYAESNARLKGMVPFSIEDWF